MPSDFILRGGEELDLTTEVARGAMTTVELTGEDGDVTPTSGR